MDRATHIAAADRNYVAAYQLVARHARWDVAGETRQFGRAIAVVTGHPTSGYWNPVLVLEQGTAPEDIASAIAWVRGLGVPASVHVREGVGDEELAAELLQAGLEPEPWASPVMTVNPIPDAPALAADVRIERVDARSFDAWRRAFAESDEALGRVSRTFASSIVDDPDIRFFSGSVDDRIVATSFAVRSADVIGVYAVGTHEPYRRRGIGSAMTWAGLRAAGEWGCSTAILQSSEIGLRVYEAMGFRQVSSYVEYEPPDRSIA